MSLFGPWRERIANTLLSTAVTVSILTNNLAAAMLFATASGVYVLYTLPLKLYIYAIKFLG